MAKLSISQAWDESRGILVHDGKLIGAVALALFVLPGIVTNVIIPHVPSGEMPPAGAWIGVVFAAVVIAFIGQLSIIRLATGPHITVGDAIAHGGRRWLPFLGAFMIWAAPVSILASVLYAIVRADPANPSRFAVFGLLAVVLVGIFIVVRLIVLAPVASAESLGPIAILKRSWDLTAGNWWRLFAFLVMWFIGAVALVWSVGSVIGLLVRLFFSDFGPLSVGGIVVIMVAQLLTTFVYVVLFVMVARIYAQLSGAAGAHARVSSKGT
jgi:hypothetical protein